MSKRTTTLQPGILIQGTLDPQDLVPVFLDALAPLDPVRAAAIRAQVPVGTGPYDLDWWYSEDASWVLEDLIQDLHEQADRVGLAFGPMESDPACWGFWLDLPEDE